MPNPIQGRYWLLTIPKQSWNPPTELPDNVAYIKGQQEVGEGGFEHWQVLVAFIKKARLAQVKRVFSNDTHAELSRSDAADSYVWKEETAVAGTRFELGAKAMKRNSEKDWDDILDKAKKGKVEEIPADVQMRCWSTIQKIQSHYAIPPWRSNIKVKVFWGVTGSGKSHRMFKEAFEGGIVPYIKPPTVKWFDGYKGEKRVVMDEFRGEIGVSHLLRWFDQYPMTIEVKGSTQVFRAEEFWLCSNLHPKEWYPNLDKATLDALLRRMEITEFVFPYVPPRTPLIELAPVVEEGVDDNGVVVDEEDWLNEFLNVI